MPDIRRRRSVGRRYEPVRRGHPKPRLVFAVHPAPVPAGHDPGDLPGHGRLRHLPPEIDAEQDARVTVSRNLAGYQDPPLKIVVIDWLTEPWGFVSVSQMRLIRSTN